MIQARLQSRGRKSCLQLQNFWWHNNCQQDLAKPRHPSGLGTPPSADLRWIPSIYPGDVRWHQWPYKLPGSLANSASQWRIRRALPDSHARNSNNKNPSRDAPQGGSAANEALPLLRLALFPFAQASDRSRGNSNRGPRPMLQMLRRSLDRVSLLFQRAAQLFLYCCGTCQPDKPSRGPAYTSDRLRRFQWVCVRVPLFPFASVSLAIWS